MACAAAAAEEKAKAEEEAAKKEEELEDNKVTGFHQLKNPFPAAKKEESEYITIGPGSDILAEAKHLARQTQGLLSSETKAKHHIGAPFAQYKTIQNSSVGASSTDDYMPEVYDASDGTGTYPTHMGVMASGSNVGMTNPYGGGVLGTKSGLDQLNETKKALNIMRTSVGTYDARMINVEKEVLSSKSQMETEIAGMKEQIDSLQHKLGMIMDSLTSGAANPSENNMISVIEVRLLTKATNTKTAGGAASGIVRPTKADLQRTTLLGKLRLMSNATFSDARKSILDEFDKEGLPAAFKFFTLEDGENELLQIHERQEARTPIDAVVVYMMQFATMNIHAAPQSGHPYAF